MSTVIEVDDLGKKYIIGHQYDERYLTLRDAIASKFQRLLNKNQKDELYEEFWALSHINFNVNEGDRVGIIGRNGAGKSTLLKVLSRITEPTTGQVKIKGRVASLLEVGTGFHGELTGRENIFLNGAILGMSKSEIKKKFDEIVAFSEIEKFLDTPVKRYSSGMYVRLAFAIAAHLEPEILVVDEVLAVGDMNFQKKSVNKMEAVSKEGRTILFVSHNMPLIRTLCDRGILLDNGKIAYSGNIEEVITRYSSELDTVTLENRERPKSLSLDLKVIDISLITYEGEHQRCIDTSKPFIIRLKIMAKYDVSELTVHLGIKNISNVWLTCFYSDQAGITFDIKEGLNIIECKILPTNFISGDYVIGYTILQSGFDKINYTDVKKTFDHMKDAYGFSVYAYDDLRLLNIHSSYFVEHNWVKIL